LQCVAVCCSVSQCDAVCCSVLQCVAVCGSVLQCVAVCCSVLQCVAVWCSVLQCVAVCCIMLKCATWMPAAARVHVMQVTAARLWQKFSKVSITWSILAVSWHFENFCACPRDAGSCGSTLGEILKSQCNMVNSGSELTFREFLFALTLCR